MHPRILRHRELLHRQVDREGAGEMEKEVPDDHRRHHRPPCPLLLQVFVLLPRRAPRFHRHRPPRLQLLRGGKQQDVRHALARRHHHPARGNLVLHVPGDELLHRHLPRQDQARHEHPQLRVLPLVLPAARRGPHRARRQVRSAALQAVFPPAPRVRHGRVLDLERTWQEDYPERLPGNKLRGPRVRPAAALHGPREPHRALRLFPAGLRRLLGLYRHCHRRCPPDGFSPAAELQQPLQGALPHRILAPLAHLAFQLVARLQPSSGWAS